MSLFYYDADTLSPTMYDLNFEVRNSIILKQITVNASRHIIRQYHFSYNAVPELGIYLLVSVEETGNSQDGVVRRYVLQHEPPATLETASVWSGGPGPGIPIGNQCVTGDFNGDGKTDLACYTGNAGNWHALTRPEVVGIPRCCPAGRDRGYQFTINVQRATSTVTGRPISLATPETPAIITYGYPALGWHTRSEASNFQLA
jgi:FG-GAP repeat protein